MRGVFEYNLGHLTLRSISSRLQLKLSCRANLTSAEHTDPIIWTQIVQQIIHRSDSVQPWIFRGPGFRLVLSLRIELGFDQDQTEFLIHNLTAELRTAELWNQLNLTPTSIHFTCAADSNSGTITTHLDYRDSSLTTSITTRHKPNGNTSFQDLRPPDGLRRAALDAVYIDLVVHVFDAERYCPMPTPKSHQLSKSQMPHQSQHCPSDALDDANSYYDFEHDILEVDDQANQFVGCPTYLQHGSTPALVESVSPFVFQRAAAARHMDAVLALVAAGLKHVCHKPRFRSSNGISIAEDTMVDRLSGLAPAIWSPGFLPAMTSRSIFLPTLSRSLVNFQAMRTKAALSQNIAASGGCSLSSLTWTRSALAKRLWNKMHNKLFDPKSAARLKLFHLPGPACSTPSDTEPELYSQEESQGIIDNDIEHCIEDDDVILLETPAFTNDENRDSEIDLLDFGALSETDDEYTLPEPTSGDLSHSQTDDVSIQDDALLYESDPEDYEMLLSNV